jgi:NAD(P)-dependent dehydrogenase (short-subunit alcohol dehydrogenase family)
MSERSQPRVLITAGAGGIGRETVNGFIESGARVHVGDVDEGALEALVASHPDVSGTVVDVADPRAVDRLFDEGFDSLGGLDSLVACAGIGGPTGPVEDLALEDWRRCFGVNLEGAFLCARRAAPIMKATGSGSIVLISSTAGLYGYPLRTPYAAAKWGVIGLAKSLAMELGPFGVRVNAVCPGSVEGPRMEAVIANESTTKGIAADAVRARYQRGVSMRTFVTAGDIADMILFLCSPAGARVSGQAISVDGHTENLGSLEN